MSDVNLPTGVTEWPEKTVKELQTLPDSVESVVQNKKIDLAAGPLNWKQREVWDVTWKYLDLYQKQNDTAKALEQRAEEKKKEEEKKEEKKEKLCFNPSFLKFDDDIVIYSGWMPSVQPHIFSVKDWTFEEIPVLPEKIHYDGNNGVICRNIRIVENWVYSVELVHMKNRRVEQHKWSDYNEVYFIDKSWKILDQIWKLWTFLDEHWVSNERHIRKNSRWFRELLEEKYEWNKNIESKLTIFDKNFDVLFTIENSQQYWVQYCDEEICICQDKMEYFPKKYIILSKTWIIAQWTEDELKWNEHMQKFLEREELRQKRRKENDDKKREKRRLPFGERFKEINHCVMSLNEKRDIATIQNEEWKTLYEIKDILDFYEDDYKPEFRTRDWNFRITERDKDSRVLCIHKYVRGYAKKSIFINKATWEKLEFEWYKWENLILQWRLIEVFVNWYDSEIYDENLDKLWMRLWSGYWLYAVARQENWGIRSYLYDSNTWKELFEIDGESGSNIIKRTYEDEKWQYHLIIEKKDWTLVEIVP